LLLISLFQVTIEVKSYVSNTVTYSFWQWLLLLQIAG